MHAHPPLSPRSSTRTLFYVLILNLVFFIIEAIGGYLTNSIAILTDAFHDLGDTLVIGIALVLEKLSQKESNETFSYGYKRLSLLAATFTSLFLMAGSITILFFSFPRFYETPEVHSVGMLLLAMLGLGVNLWASQIANQGSTASEKTISLHFIEDVLGWLSVLVGSIFIYFLEWNWIDPLLSVLFAGFIFRAAFLRFLENLGLFMQAVPRDIKVEEIEQDILNAHPSIQSFHDFHLWTLDGSRHILTVHIVVNQDLSLEKQQRISEYIEKRINEKGNFHLTASFEREDLIQ